MRSLHSPLAVVLGMAAVLSTALVVGCSSGPPTGQVQGKVTFKGKPVTEGSIMLLNLEEGGTAGADLGPDGSFVITRPVRVGEYIVVISPAIHIVDTDPGRSPPAPVEKPAPDIPPKYRMQGSTPLKAQVKTGKNDFAFDMKP